MASDWLRYANQGATRNLPLSPNLVSALSFLPELGVSMEVFSGGQPSSGSRRTGSHRHDGGNAADVFFYKDGRQLNWENPNDRPIFEQIVSKGKSAGITGIGAGDGYMRPGSMHIGFGAPAVWGAGGHGSNAPGWLRAAYNGTTAPQPQNVASNIGGDSLVPRDHSAEVAAQTNVPLLSAPQTIADHPVAQPQDIQTAEADGPPKGLLSLLRGDDDKEGKSASSLLSMLGAMSQQQAPQMLQPPQQAQGPTLADILTQYMQSRTV